MYTGFLNFISSREGTRMYVPAIPPVPPIAELDTPAITRDMPTVVKRWNGFSASRDSQ